MNSIQKKIWGFALTVLFIMTVIWVSLTYYNQKMQDQYNDILERYLVMNDVPVKSQQVVASLNNYLLDPSLSNWEKLKLNMDIIEKAKNEVVTLRNEENHFELTNYVNLIESLIETIDRSLMFQSERETQDSTIAFSEATRISKYISEMTLTLIDTEFKTYDLFYRSMINQSESLKELGIWLFLLITFLLLLFTYWFSMSITRPIKNLTYAAHELSKGRFDLKIEVESNDEISFLAKTFDRMRSNINSLISEIQHKAQLEKELQESKLLLHQSQLRSLQSQINPHFLFNTLNTLSKKAYLEGSEETSDLLVNVAGMLRYNLKQLDKPITLREEVHVLWQYIEIQKARFTDRLNVHKDIDESCLNAQIPHLTLQPIIENALIHAIEPREEGGNIWIRIHASGEWILIEMIDDGPGMPDSKVRQILEEIPIESEGHSTGIGFTNVVKRLRLFYENHDVIDIESEMGFGTKVTLKIPSKRRPENHD
ncbi:sensor histidine kinase [Bacillaceae bacterium S4-13-58]